jgi:hypothetical protein
MMHHVLSSIGALGSIGSVPVLLPGGTLAARVSAARPRPAPARERRRDPLAATANPAADVGVQEIALAVTLTNRDRCHSAAGALPAPLGTCEAAGHNGEQPEPQRSEQATGEANLTFDASIRSR